MLVNFKRSFYVFGLLFFIPVIALGFDEFDCVGAEPFWKLSITNQKFTFTQQGASRSTMTAVEPILAENMNFDHIRVFRTKLNAKDVIIVIQKQSCTDGMSDSAFAYEGLFITNNKVFHGCCSKKLLLTR